MTSFSSSLSGELLQCHICLEVLTDPVTTSCGHNFCNVCIEACWESGQLYRCPLCKEGFDSKPELKINVAFQKVVDRYKVHQQPKKLQHQTKTFPQMLCDVCSENKLRAVKSCLHCVTSFCETHLTNHKTAPRLVRHKLIDPVDNLEDYICEKHDKPLEMFCRDDQTCLCLFCTETEHKTHNAVPIEEESGHKRIQLEKTQSEIKVMIQDRCNKIKEIKNLTKSNKSTNERNKANKVELFTDLIHSIERCQSELLEVMEQKQTAAETQAEELIKELEQEITELKRRNTELEQLSHTEDHLHLLQVYSSVCSPPEVKSWTNINIKTDLLNTDILDKALTCLKEKVNKELKKIHDITQPSVVHGINFNPPTSQPSTNGIFEFGSTNRDSAPFHHSLLPKSSSAMEKIDTLRTQKGILTEISNIKTSNVQTEGKIYFTLGKTDFGTRSMKKAEKINKQVKVSWFGLSLNTIQQLYAVDVILDPNTAHPKLILSKDGKQVSHGGSWRDVPNNPERFDSSACVLGKDGFSCGRFYFVVQVGDKTEWDLGMTRESIERKGKVTVCPEKGFWCIWLRNGGEYVANEYCPVPLSLKDKPQKVGVFVDYEEGLVSFYNVETKALIYSFTGQSFTEKIFPFFSPCNKRGDVNTKPLIIHTA
ncbi:E3 ubiquitin-protein ligase TRIM39-like [Sinocyclocheilus rhinocerous]|uniref:E3 ubiquitin-protein ligase TRIM39-like n=1 Tax=Sinocyclocheilus rhinocerous TaxID=307959 RepID=UPI0007BADAE1|nr:PREDICTED: E3 ubiquitin-protein ligase TRIM39-like [Sinocyclocheilus rhinocerous]